MVVGPVTIRSPSASKAGFASFAIESRAEIQPLVAGAARTVPVGDGARGRRGTVGAVGAGRECEDARDAVELEGGGQRELLTSAAGPSAAHRHLRPADVTTQAGAATGPRPAAMSRATRTRSRATSRASPASDRVSTQGVRPRDTAHAVAASTTSALLPITTLSTRSNSASPGFGVSGDRAGCALLEPRAHGRRHARQELEAVEHRERVPNVDASGAVGPEPITSSGSPITSDRRRADTRAGAAARAS